MFMGTIKLRETLWKICFTSSFSRPTMIDSRGFSKEPMIANLVDRIIVFHCVRCGPPFFDEEGEQTQRTQETEVTEVKEVVEVVEVVDD